MIFGVLVLWALSLWYCTKFAYRLGGRDEARRYLAPERADALCPACGDAFLERHGFYAASDPRLFCSRTCAKADR